MYRLIQSGSTQFTKANAYPYELQAMLDLQENYARQENYSISETKSTVLVTGNHNTHEFVLNDTVLQQADTATHLGISRDSKTKFDSSTVAQERIGTARRATYAMMGAGLHGASGLNPCISIHLIRIYIVPRLTYGLEAIRMATKDLTAISKYYKRLLKQLQHLPDKAADSACYLLLGEPPIQAEIHKRIFTTYGLVFGEDGIYEDPAVVGNGEEVLPAVDNDNKVLPALLSGDTDFGDDPDYNPDLNERVVRDEFEFENEDDDENNCKDSQKSKKRKKIGTRVKWTPQELAEIQKYFKDNLTTKTTPGRRECDAAITKSKAKNGVLQHRNWETIKKKVWNLIKKLPIFRSYKPIDEKLQDIALPKAKPSDVNDRIQTQMEAAKSENMIEEVDLMNLAPRKPDWDLKRDVAKKLEKLEKRTQRAIAELIRERLKSGNQDLAQVVNAGTMRSNQTEEDDDD